MVTAVKDAPKDHMFSPQGEYAVLHINQIVVAEGFNNRRALGDLDELTESIKSMGVLEPLIVWLPEGENRLYHLVAGERRLAAAKKAGLTIVPAIIRDLDDKGRLEALIVENLQRKDIDPLEEAEGYKRLLGFGLKQQEIATKVGRSPGHVSKRLSLLELPAEAQKAVADGTLKMADAVELAPFVTEPEVIAKTLEHAVQAARHGYYFNASQTAKNELAKLERDRRRETAIAGLKAAKVSLIKGSYTNHPELGSGHRQIPITAAKHKTSPCHAAYLDYENRVHYVCTKPANHKKDEDPAVVKAVKALTERHQYTHQGQREISAKQKAAYDARKKLLTERHVERTSQIKRLLTARQKREEVLDFTLRQLLQLVIDGSDGETEFAAQVLELPATKKHKYGRPDVDWASWLSTGQDRLFRLAYAVALASGEAPLKDAITGGYFDSTYSPNAARYLVHLTRAGYKPEKAELEQVGKNRGIEAFDVKPKGKEKKS